MRCSIIQDAVVSGMTTAGYSLPWERWMVTKRMLAAQSGIVCIYPLV